MQRISIHLHLTSISGVTTPYSGGFIRCMTVVLTHCPSLKRSSEGGWQRWSYFTSEVENLLFLKLHPLFPIRAIFLSRALLRLCATKKTSEIRPGIHPTLCPWAVSDKLSGPAWTLSCKQMFFPSDEEGKGELIYLCLSECIIIPFLRKRSSVGNFL